MGRKRINFLMSEHVNCTTLYFVYIKKKLTKLTDDTFDSTKNNKWKCVCKTSWRRRNKNKHTHTKNKKNESASTKRNLYTENYCPFDQNKMNILFVLWVARVVGWFWFRISRAKIECFKMNSIGWSKSLEPKQVDRRSSPQNVIHFIPSLILGSINSIQTKNFSIFSLYLLVDPEQKLNWIELVFSSPFLLWEKKKKNSFIKFIVQFPSKILMRKSKCLI